MKWCYKRPWRENVEVLRHPVTGKVDILFGVVAHQNYFIITHPPLSGKRYGYCPRKKWRPDVGEWRNGRRYGLSEGIS